VAAAKWPLVEPMIRRPEMTAEHTTATAGDRPTEFAAIPLYAPHVGDSELLNLADCLARTELIHGPWVGSFERRIADYVGSEHGVGTNSGTSALHTALLVAGIRPDEEVLITTMTFIAPANAIRYVGAHPVFIDVEPVTWQMDPTRVHEFLTVQCRRDKGRTVNRRTGRSVSAIVAVHYLGMPVDLAPLQALADEYGLILIEDAAQALGTLYRGRRVGSLGLLGCFSFHGNKLITAGGGGMIVTQDPKLAARARYLINQAKDDPVETAHKSVGYNYRMTNLHGAIGCAQFDRIDMHIDAKRHIARRYAAAFEGVPGLSLVPEAPQAHYTYWLSTMLVDPEHFGLSARQLMAALKAQRIESLPLYEPLHRSVAHAGAQVVGGTQAEHIASRALSLPSSVGLSEADQERVVHAVLAAHRAAT
jgi:perosamine synthetase